MELAQVTSIRTTRPPHILPLVAGLPERSTSTSQRRCHLDRYRRQTRRGIRLAQAHSCAMQLCSTRIWRQAFVTTLERATLVIWRLAVADARASAACKHRRVRFMLWPLMSSSLSHSDGRPYSGRVTSMVSLRSPGKVVARFATSLSALRDRRSHSIRGRSTIESVSERSPGKVNPAPRVSRHGTRIVLLSQR